MADLIDAMDVAASAMNAQSKRLNTTASNLANAESTTSPDGKTYRAKQVVFKAKPMNEQAVGVSVAQVVESNTPLKMVYNPQHPNANEQGYVALPNVNPIEEMVNMISASQSYQNSAEMAGTAKSLAQKTLAIGQ